MREKLTKCSDSTCKMGKNFSQPKMSFSHSRHRNKSNQYPKLYPNRYSLKKVIPRVFLLILCYFKQREALFFPKVVPLYFPEKVWDMDGIPAFKLLLLSSKDPSILYTALVGSTFLLYRPSSYKDLQQGELVKVWKSGRFFCFLCKCYLNNRFYTKGYTQSLYPFLLLFIWDQPHCQPERYKQSHLMCYCQSSGSQLLQLSTNIPNLLHQLSSTNCQSSESRICGTSPAVLWIHVSLTISLGFSAT